jgi:predicted dehydrogenase
MTWAVRFSLGFPVDRRSQGLVSSNHVFGSPPLAAAHRHGARAGKHVLCDKPMADSAAECQQMVAAGQKAGKNLMIEYRLYYEPFNNALIKVVGDQEFGRGRVVLADAGFALGDPTQWRRDKKMAGRAHAPVKL